MKKTTDTLWKTMVLLLGIGFIWCLSLPYFMLSNADQDIISVATINRLGRDGNVGEGTAEGKGKLKDEMIKDLRADKLRLQLAHMEKAPPLMKRRRDGGEKEKNCPLPPMDNHPECMGKLKWLSQMWESQPCYAGYGVNGSVCSFVIYLSEAGSDHAVVRENLTDLYPSLEKRSQFRWIEQRIRSMERVWVEAGRSLSAKYNLKDRKAKQILVHPGVVTAESKAKIAEAAFEGGPLGELVQWSDLISTLHILGHHVYLTASLPDLRHYFGVDTGGCPPFHSNPNLIYTDIIGLRQIKSVLKGSWFKYRCIIRVLDTFGTEPDFNHISWANKHKLASPFGRLNMIPLQFYTMFPHTPDNTFLGFVVQNQLMSEQSELFKSMGQLTTEALPNYVKNHGIVKGTDVQALLRKSKVFVGLSFPYEGPAPLEALANGCAFLNPKLNPPQSSLNTKFFKGKPNIREIISQHPYAEAIGEPYVWTVDMNNSIEVERALNAILNQTVGTFYMVSNLPISQNDSAFMEAHIEPYLPYEFSCEGMLQRVNVLIEKQDLCSSAVSWPPLSALQVVKAQMSCKTACQKAGLICEPAFFPHLNNANSLAKNSVDCQTSEFSASGLVFPAYNSTQHCWFQSDPLLFSCVRSDESLTRVCPCRDFIKDQIALCKDCI
ncbi:hypothetical protein F7725_001751 [Dissostichus mawsoni]|uniref:alpha-1,6-mannosyl-glycoprotein 6-beta-N-acetylglucosaminyltransferase n=1 Tax=Dissostichus mawsoni TaxID=36200 RepID=A0A7J5Y0H3_DISMA|nr:hypothetical protein F7725_001751 [Dissostichus mawsoni]